MDKDRNFLEKELKKLEKKKKFGNEFSEWIQILIKTPDLYVISGGKTT